MIPSRTAFPLWAICFVTLLTPVHAALTAEQTAICQQLGLDANQIAALVDKPLYNFTELEVDAYLKYLSAAEPNLRQRIIHLARKNLGQPYELYLLGEMPFEPYDPQPLYCLDEERLRRLRRAHVRDGAHSQLAQLHEDAPALALPRWPPRGHDPQPLHRGRLGYLQPLARGRHHRAGRRRHGREVFGEDRSRAVLQESLQARRRRAGRNAPRPVSALRRNRSGARPHSRMAIS